MGKDQSICMSPCLTTTLVEGRRGMVASRDHARAAAQRPPRLRDHLHVRRRPRRGSRPGDLALVGQPPPRRARALARRRAGRADRRTARHRVHPTRRCTRQGHGRELRRDRAGRRRAARGEVRPLGHDRDIALDRGALAPASVTGVRGRVPIDRRLGDRRSTRPGSRGERRRSAAAVAGGWTSRASRS